MQMNETGHLELAWKMLELAKSIWAANSKTDTEAKAVYYLQELSLGSNNYSQFVEDLTKAMLIKVKTAPAGSGALTVQRIQLLEVGFVKCLSALMLLTRMVSHPTDMIYDIKGRIAEPKEKA